MGMCEKIMWFILGAVVASVVLMGAVVIWNDLRNRL